MENKFNNKNECVSYFLENNKGIQESNLKYDHTFDGKTLFIKVDGAEKMEFKSKRNKWELVKN